MPGIVLAACVVLAAGSSAQPPQTVPQEIDGPTYTAEKIRNIHIAGVRLNMTVAEARQALEAQGFVLEHEHPEALVFQKGGWKEDVWLYHVKVDGRTRIASIAYTIDIPNEELVDAERWRREIVSRVGKPTEWRQRVHATPDRRLQVIRDHFSLTPNRDHDARDAARSCLINWQCEAVMDDTDCRPIVQRHRGASIEGYFIWEGLYISAHNDTVQAAALRSDPEFRKYDLAKASCFVLPVH